MRILRKYLQPAQSRNLRFSIFSCQQLQASCIGQDLKESLELEQRMQMQVEASREYCGTLNNKYYTEFR